MVIIGEVMHITTPALSISKLLPRWHPFIFHKQWWKLFCKSQKSLTNISAFPLTKIGLS